MIVVAVPLCCAPLLMQSAEVKPAFKPLFTEIGDSALAGIETHCGSTRKDYIIEVDGGGVLLGDFNADGNMDVVFVDGSTLERVAKKEPGYPPRMFFGKGDCTFTAAGASWEMRGGRWGMGGAVGDLNDDGWLDLVITEWGPTRVFMNDAGKGLIEVTAKSGLKDGEWGTSAALLDYDKDGKLDLIVINYLAFDPQRIGKPGSDDCRWKGHDVMCGPEGLTPQLPRLYRGNGDGTFEDTTLKAKLVPDHPGFGLGVMTLDYDGNGTTDIYVANDSTANHLWENQGDGTFVEVAFKRGASHNAQGKEGASMGIACADWNGDGRDDLFVTNFSGENDVFYVSSKVSGFRERSTATGLAGPSIPMLGWGTTLADFDLDGDLDITVLNGHVYPQADLPGTDTSYSQPCQFYRNDGNGRFTLEPMSNVNPFAARASAAADFDNDGDLDLVALRVEGQVLVFRNDAQHGPTTHWLRVALRARGGNRNGLGAKVTAEWKGGKQTAEMRTAGGFQAAVPAEVHFGLGAVDRVDRLVIDWPSGAKQVVDGVGVDRRLVVEEQAREKKE